MNKQEAIKINNLNDALAIEVNRTIGVNGGHVLSLIGEDDLELYKESEPVEFTPESLPEIKQLVLDLGMTMRHNKGIGLSAIQCGIKKKVFVIETGEPIPTVFFNPRIVELNPETIELDEGCLSFPKLFMQIKRAKTVRLRYQDMNGVFHTQLFDGMTARVVLHEFDHLCGITFKQRVSKLKLEMAEKKRKKRV